MAAKRSSRDTDPDFYLVQENSGSNSNVPAFLMKLWTLVEDPSNDDIITWDVKGKSFHIFDQSRFQHEVLPFYFKHNNISSFIRQLNMYGFRKVVKVEQGGLKVEHDDLEFQHMYFQRGQEHLLELIKRRSAPIKSEPRAVSVNPNEMTKVLTDVTQIKSKQETIATSMVKLKRENEALWREVALLRQKHAKQEQIVNKLLQFLLSLVNSRGRGMSSMPGLSRKRPLMINHKPQNPDVSPAKQPNLHLDVGGDHDYTVQSPGEVPTSPSTSSVVIQELLEPTHVQQEQPNIAVSLPQSGNISIPMEGQLAPSPPLPSISPVAPSTSIPIVQPVSSGDATKLSLLDQAMISAKLLPSSSQPQQQQQQQPVVSLATQPVLGVQQPLFVEPPAVQAQQQQRQRGQEEASSKQIVLRGVKDKPQQPSTAAAGASSTSFLNDPQLCQRQSTVAKVAEKKDMTEQIDLLQSDLDSLRETLSSGQYSLDPSFLVGLFDPQSPLPVNMDSFLDSLNVNGDDSGQEMSTIAAVDSTQPSGNITGQEIWQYQPPENLPELFDGLVEDKPQDDPDSYTFNDLPILFEDKEQSLGTPAPPTDTFSDISHSITAEDLD